MPYACRGIFADLHGHEFIFNLLRSAFKLVSTYGAVSRGWILAYRHWHIFCILKSCIDKRGGVENDSKHKKRTALQNC